MSGKVSGLVWELDIPHEHAWLLMSLADHAEHDGTSVRPGGGLTAWKTGYSVRHVKRLIADLMNTYDLLEVVDPGGGAKPAEYRIKIENFSNHKKPERLKRGRPKQTHDPHDTGLAEKPMTSNEKTHDIHARARKKRQLETSYSRRDADASRGKEKDKTNWFDIYCLRSEELGLPISGEDRDRVPGNLLRCATKEKASVAEMHRVIARMLQRRLAGVILSPQEALKDVRGIPPEERNVHRSSEREPMRVRAEER